MKKAIAVLLSMVLALTFLAGCSGGTAGGGADADVIKIGVFEPLTGANAAGGELEVRGIELANELFPEVLGKQVVLVKADNKSDTVEAANAASRLVESDKVDVVLGSWGSSLAMAGGDAFKNSETPAIGTSCTNKNVTLGNDYYFRVCFIDPYQGKVMANYTANELGKTKVGIIYEVSNDYAVGLRDAFVESFEAMGGEIVAEGMYNTGDQDFNSQLLTVMAQNPEVIFAPGNYTESALIMKQARELGYADVQFLGGDTWETNPLIEVGGDAVEGCVFSTFFDETTAINEMTSTFLEAYQAKYNEAPAAVAALGFDAYLAAIKAIEAAGTTDGPAVRDALAALSFEGCTGTTTFDEIGDANKAAVLKTVKDGKFTFVAAVAAE